MTPQHLNRLALLPDKYLMDQELPRFEQSFLKMVHSHKDDKMTDEFMKFPTDKEIANHANKQEHTLEDVKKQQQVHPQEIINEVNKMNILNRYPNITERNERMQNYAAFKARIDASANAFDLSLLLEMALTKIPQIPFEYILDVFRWDLFSGKVQIENSNEYFWKLLMKHQGIHSPSWSDRRTFFDAGAKFHVADNTPFVRYSKTYSSLLC